MRLAMLTMKRALIVLPAMVMALVLSAHAAEKGRLQRDANATPAPVTTPTGDNAAAEATKQAAPHDENGIVALVNDFPITQYELRQRVSLMMTTTGLPNTPEMKKKVREQVLDQLETELLQRQEAQKNDISVSSVDVDKYMQSILDENHMTQDQLKAILARGGVQISTFRAQLAAQLLWQKAVQEHFAGRVNIAPETVDAEMARIAEGANRAHFTVSEIFLPVDNPDQDEKIHKDAESLVAQLKAGGQFANIARQFSQSPSAREGGDIGTVYDGQLAPELNKALLAMKTGDLSEPIRSIGGYYILLLRQRFEPAGTKIEQVTPTAASLPSSLQLGRILLRLPPKMDDEYLKKVMGIAEQIKEGVHGCEMASKIPEQMKGILYFPLGDVRLADLNQQARDALAKTEPGGNAEPFKSDVGIEIFVRCDKPLIKQVAFELPKREQIENQLFSEQISALARRYARDLRRSAHIEVR
jgi:peptidyl-prolyl cis-trans isomerase SurA